MQTFALQLPLGPPRQSTMSLSEPTLWQSQLLKTWVFLKHRGTEITENTLLHLTLCSLCLCVLLLRTDDQACWCSRNQHPNHDCLIQLFSLAATANQVQRRNADWHNQHRKPKHYISDEDRLFGWINSGVRCEHRKKKCSYARNLKPADNKNHKSTPGYGLP